MSLQHHGHAHEFEPQHGLPERLPAGEAILWQASPDVASLARHAFHLRTLAAYFALLLAAATASQLWAGAGWLGSLLALRWPLLLAALGLGSVALLAWLTARTTVYTLTNRRVVMRLGVVLTVSFNLPLRSLAGAALRSHGDGSGDITLQLAGRERIAFLQLWPSVRPWRVRQPEPMLRGLPDAARLAARLQQAWAAETGLSVAAAAHPSAAPAAGARQGAGQWSTV